MANQFSQSSVHHPQRDSAPNAITKFETKEQAEAAELVLIEKLKQT